MKLRSGDSGGSAFFSGPAHFRNWLEENHGTACELIVGFHRRSSGRESMTWPESVAEALCFGWIDGVRRRMEDHSYTIRFTPRKPASIWRTVNITKMRELIAASRVHPAGMRAFERRDVKKTAGAKRVAELIACCEAGQAIPSLVLSRNPLKRRASLRSG